MIEVTNGNDSGAGSLRIALSGDSGPRQVVIRTHDDIVLSSPITVTNGDLTLTSEGTGVITGAGLRFTGADNVILYNVRIRPGLRDGMSQMDIDTNDALALIGCAGVVIDHCALGWSTDELIDINGSTNVSIQNCILHEALENAGHSGGNHSMAILLSMAADNISILNNLIAHCADRVPALTTINAAGTRLNVEVYGNVIYNSKSPASAQPASGPLTISLRGNTRVGGPDTPGEPTDFDHGMFLIDSGSGLPDTQYVAGCIWYESDNIAPDSPFVIEYPHSEGHVDWPAMVSEAPTLSSYEPMTRETAYTWVLANAGTLKRDSHEQRVVTDVEAGTGAIIDDTNTVR